MRGLVTESAKVVDRADQTAAKEMMPEAVDDHPSRQGIGRAGDFVGQFQSAARGCLERPIVEHLQKPARHRFTRLGHLAPNKQGLVECDSFMNTRCAPWDGDLRLQPTVRRH